MKRLLVALALVLGLGCQRGYAPSCSAPSEERYLSALGERTVQIEKACAGVKTGLGSGLILGPAHGGVIVATAAHVTSDTKCTYTVQGRSMRLLVMDIEADVTLAFVAWPTLPPRLLEASKSYLGMPVIVTGYPMQWATGAAEYQVSRGHLMVDHGRRLRMSAPTYLGNSGGPVWDEHGHLVGLFVSLVTLGQSPAPADGAYYVTPAKRVLELYEGLPRPRRE